MEKIKLKKQKEQAETERRKQEMENFKDKDLGFCGVDPKKVTKEFRDSRELSYQRTFLKEASFQDFVVLKSMQNFPMRKDMKRVSLGNFNSYKDVARNPLMLQKLERVNGFLQTNCDVYVTYGKSCKKQLELLKKIVAKTQA